MKSRIMLIGVVGILFVSWGTAIAQISTKGGVKVGVSISKMEYEHPFLNFHSRTALAGGAFLVVDMAGPLDVQLEALYIPKGATEDYPARDEAGNDLGEVTSTFQANYLEIPLLARYNLGSSPVHILAGPALAIKLSSKITTSSNDQGAEGMEADWEIISGSDFGLVVGAGVALPTGFGEIVLDGRYTMGISNVNDYDDSEIKNAAYVVMAGVAF